MDVIMWCLLGSPVGDLGADDFERRAAASARLESGGAAGCLLALSLRDHPDPEVRHRARAAVRKSGTQPVADVLNALAVPAGVFEDGDPLLARRVGNLAKGDPELLDRVMRAAVIRGLAHPDELALGEYADGAVLTLWARARVRDLGYRWRDERELVENVIRGCPPCRRNWLGVRYWNGGGR